MNKYAVAIGGAFALFFTSQLSAAKVELLGHKRLHLIGCGIDCTDQESAEFSKRIQLAQQSSPLNCNQKFDGGWSITCTAMDNNLNITNIVLNRGNLKPYCCTPPARINFGETVSFNVFFGQPIEAVITVNGTNWTFKWNPQ